MLALILEMRTGGGCHQYPVIPLPEQAVEGQVQLQAVMELVLEGISEQLEMVKLCEGCCCQVVQCVCTGWHCDVHDTTSGSNVVIRMYMPPLILMDRNQINGNSRTD